MKVDANRWGLVGLMVDFRAGEERVGDGKVFWYEYEDMILNAWT